MRLLTAHALNPLNEAIKIHVIDAPGTGGACHRYDILGPSTGRNPSATDPNGYRSNFTRTIILFQNGPIQGAGFNGITNEALLAILIDRMEGFQTGPYKSHDNAEALAHMVDALECLQRRTRERMKRGVEGTHTV